MPHWPEMHHISLLQHIHKDHINFVSIKHVLRNRTDHKMDKSHKKYKKKIVVHAWT
jgi:hypothetical protein